MGIHPFVQQMGCIRRVSVVRYTMMSTSARTCNGQMQSTTSFRAGKTSSPCGIWRSSRSVGDDNGKKAFPNDGTHGHPPSFPMSITEPPCPEKSNDFFQTVCILIVSRRALWDVVQTNHSTSAARLCFLPFHKQSGLDGLKKERHDATSSPTIFVCGSIAQH